MTEPMRDLANTDTDLLRVYLRQAEACATRGRGCLPCKRNAEAYRAELAAREQRIEPPKTRTGEE